MEKYRPHDSNPVKPPSAEEDRMSQNKLDKLETVIEEGAVASLRERLSSFGQWTRQSFAEASAILLSLLMAVLHVLAFIIQLLRRVSALNRRQKQKKAFERERKYGKPDALQKAGKGSVAGSPTL